MMEWRCNRLFTEMREEHIQMCEMLGKGRR